jgi:methionine synthase reductase
MTPIPSNYTPMLSCWYGTQLGYSKDLATMIAGQMMGENIPCRGVFSLDQWEEEHFYEEDLVVIVCSTTGQGDAPDNAIRFWKALRSLPDGSAALKGLRWSLLALGDTNYQNFAAMGLAIAAKLRGLGAVEVYPSEAVDAAGNMEGAVDSWLEGLLPVVRGVVENPSPQVDREQSRAALQAALELSRQQKETLEKDKAAASQLSLPLTVLKPGELKARYGILPRLQAVVAWEEIETGVVDENNNVEGEKVKVKEGEKEVKEACEGWRPPWEDGRGSGSHPSQSTAVTVTSAALVTPASCLDRQLVRWSVQAPASLMALTAPGDAWQFICPNPSELVARLCHRLQVRGTTLFRYPSGGGRGGGDAPYATFPPHPVSATLLLTWSLDIMAPPTKLLLRLLAQHMHDPSEQHDCLTLCGSKGRESYRALWEQAPSENSEGGLLTCLHRWPSCQPPLKALLAVLHPLVARSFSVASMRGRSKESQEEVEVVVKEEEGLNSSSDGGGAAVSFVARIYPQGIASTRLLQLCNNASSIPRQLLCFHNGHDSFRVPSTAKCVILVGVGTGIAPLHSMVEGFFQAAKHKNENRHDGTVIPALHCYVGCRREEEDFLFKDDWPIYQAAGILTSFRVAFSRKEEKKETKTKTYVQHLMMEDAEVLSPLLMDKDTWIMACGSAAHVLSSVTEGLQHVLKVGSSGNGDSDSDTAAELAAAWKDVQSRFKMDVWR